MLNVSAANYFSGTSTVAERAARTTYVLTATRAEQGIVLSWSISPAPGEKLNQLALERASSLASRKLAQRLKLQPTPLFSFLEISRCATRVSIVSL